MQSEVSKATGVIDAAVHPTFVDPDDLRQLMREPYARFDFPGPTRFLYPIPTMPPIGGAYLEEARDGSAFPGSNPSVTLAWLDRAGIDRAVLAPLTRGISPNIELTSEICRATNEWLAATWLGEGGSDRFLGSIRINPRDPATAVAEIERWADDKRMVQIAVPLEAHQPYGQRTYLPIWEAAAECGLPVAVHVDGGGGATYSPTINGEPRTFAEYNSIVGLSFIYHLGSLIGEGVFERLPRLRFIFGDGGHDALTPFMWRMDTNWPATRIEVPWLTQDPSAYLRDHVRFITSPLEGPPPEYAEEWAQIWRPQDLLIYGSHFPHWSAMTPDQLEPGLDGDDRDRILGSNAAEFLSLA
jgi:predicted TIM-barrel fold metal-dependent hydrolase